MLEFLRSIARDREFARRLPGLVLAFLVAEFFYKFHSFALECLAFLATWLVIDLVLDRAVPARHRAVPPGTDITS